jgi:hypothetical protein
MGAKSRRKGQRGEREVAAIFTGAGIPMRRSGAEGQLEGDLANDANLYVEVRYRETLSIPAWLREVEQKKGDRLGALVFRRSREPWHVAITLSDYIALLTHSRPPRTMVCDCGSILVATDGEFVCSECGLSY